MKLFFSNVDCFNESHFMRNIPLTTFLMHKRNFIKACERKTNHAQMTITTFIMNVSMLTSTSNVAVNIRGIYMKISICQYVKKLPK